MEISPELIAAVELAKWPILALPGVVGIGIGLREVNNVLFDELAIRVYVNDLSQVPFGIPEIVGGVGVCIIELQIQPCVLEDAGRYDRIVGGIKISKPTLGVGTLGAVVQDSETGEPLGLSCYHVVGDTNTDFPDTIWQPIEPNLIAGSTIPPDDNIGHVVRVDYPRTQPLPFSPVLVGLVDAAVFKLGPALEQGRNFSPEIMDILIDRITDTAWPVLGQEVRKRGFMTRLTEGRIVDARFQYLWRYSPHNSCQNTWLIEQALIMGSGSNPDNLFCVKGDSGSVVLDKYSPTAVGLLWGGDGKYGIMSHIRNVESQLKINMVWS